MRFTSQLADDQFDWELLAKLEGPYFVGPAQRVSPRQFLVKILEKQGITEASDPKKFEEELRKVNTKANRLRWMLDCTMGAQGDFDRRRAEMILLNPELEGKVTDDDVVKSYLDWVAPGGDLREFLKLGVLAYLDKPTQTLFVHGCVSYPWLPTNSESSVTVEEWVNALNEWKDQQLKDWEDHPYWVKGRENEHNAPTKNWDTFDWGARGGNRLMAYAAPDSEPTVIYADMFSAKNNIQELPVPLVQILKASDIRRVVVGHKPHGFCPSVLKTSEIEFIDADTSYSDMKSPDCRGKAVSNVLISRDKVTIHGVLADGTAIHYDLSSDPKVEGDPFVGRRVDHNGEDGWWVKAKLQVPKEDGTEYIFQKVDGFKVEYAFVKKTDVKLKASS